MTLLLLLMIIYSYFKKGCRKTCARDNPEMLYADMINKLFLTL